jgi:mannose-6-phosphate isomerase
MKPFNYLEKEERPWGLFYVVHNEKHYKIKRLEIFPGKRLSYQYHTKRSESWIIIQGNPLITLDDKVFNYKEGDTVLIGNGTKHRIENIEQKDVIIIEVQTGTYFGEDDIIRIKDDYNRI